MSMEFVGAGIAFPMRTDAIGGVALVAREREIQEAIRLILGTSPGERPMRPEFGCRISDHVFAPANATTAGQLSYDVRAALDQWEPRIDVDDVRLRSTPPTPACSTSTSPTASAARTTRATWSSPSMSFRSTSRPSTGRQR